MNKITNVKSSEQTIVNFFGIAVFLPEGYDTITMDKDGSVYVHPENTIVEAVTTTSGKGEWNSVGNKAGKFRARYSQYVCNVEYEGDWKQFVMVVDV